MYKSNSHSFMRSSTMRTSHSFYVEQRRKVLDSQPYWFKGLLRMRNNFIHKKHYKNVRVINRTIKLCIEQDAFGRGVNRLRTVEHHGVYNGKKF